MRTILTFASILGIIVFISCGPSAEEKAIMEAKRKAREDSLIKAMMDSVKTELAKKQAYLDSLINAINEKKERKEDDNYKNVDISEEIQKTVKMTNEYIQNETNNQKMLEEMQKSLQQLQQMRQFQNYH